ncbi:MAG: hypothetical protein ACK6BG_13230 [Cyanobacteriota bacterium]
MHKSAWVVKWVALQDFPSWLKRPDKSKGLCIILPKTFGEQAEEIQVIKVKADEFQQEKVPWPEMAIILYPEQRKLCCWKRSP